jgi:hypothetical protein
MRSCSSLRVDIRHEYPDLQVECQPMAGSGTAISVGQSRGYFIKVRCADFSGNATNTFALVLAPAIR